MIFTEELCRFILVKTNEKLETFLTTNLNESLKTQYMSPFVLNEVYAFLGLMILIGVYRGSREPIADLFSLDENIGRPIFRATIPRERFKCFLRFLRFDSNETRSERLLHDRLAPIREVFEVVRNNIFSLYSPGVYITLDEHLCKYKGRCIFRQFMPSKPDRFGIKFFIIADTVTFYPINMEIYLGKSHLSNKPEDVSMRLLAVLGEGHIIVADNYFSSLKLADRLLEEKKLHYFGTIRKIRKEVPKTFYITKNVPEFSSKFLFYNNSCLVSYIPKKNRCVLLLTNVHHDKTISEHFKQKPQVILDYNRNKVGVDKLDQLVKEYRPYRTTRRWPVVIFFYLIAFASHSSWVIYRLNNPECKIAQSKNRKKFLNELGMELLQPLIEDRKRSPSFRFLSKGTKRSIDASIPTNSDSNNESTLEVDTKSDKKSVRCYLCKRAKDRKVRTKCHNCSNYVCSDHSYTISVCDHCQPEWLM